MRRLLSVQVGNVFTIEPMICEGTYKHVMWDDQWTATTRDGRRSAQFEHTLLVTPTGVEALTARLPTSNPFFWELEGYEEPNLPVASAAASSREPGAGKAVSAGFAVSTTASGKKKAAAAKRAVAKKKNRK